MSPTIDSPVVPLGVFGFGLIKPTTTPVRDLRRRSTSISRRLRHRFSRESRQSGEHRSYPRSLIRLLPMSPTIDSPVVPLGVFGFGLIKKASPGPTTTPVRDLRRRSTSISRRLRHRFSRESRQPEVTLTSNIGLGLTLGLLPRTIHILHLTMLVGLCETTWRSSSMSPSETAGATSGCSEMEGAFPKMPLRRGLRTRKVHLVNIPCPNVLICMSASLLLFIDIRILVIYVYEHSTLKILIETGRYHPDRYLEY
jgi:hypothetical protein